MKKLTLTEHMIIMAEQAILTIQTEAATFVATQKRAYDGKDDDLVTTADLAAQAGYETYIEQHFPDEGIIGEENLAKPSNNGCYFTIDPLDGTKAFGRRQSTGVGTMIAHVDERGIVDAVCVGDVNTGELYFYGPDQEPTRKRFGIPTTLVTNDVLPVLTKTYVSLRKHTEEFPRLIQDLVRQDRGGIFKDITIECGSIGIQMARLWKGEVGMVVIEPSFDTPWDTTPLIGMDKALGLVRLILDPETLYVTELDKLVNPDIQFLKHIELILRRQYVPQVLTWIDQWKNQIA